MPRLTRKDIQETLLAGRPLSWKDAANKSASIQLETVGKRRLLAFLTQRHDQQPFGVTDAFAEGLWEAFSGTEDPASPSLNGGTIEDDDAVGSWRIRSLQSENFGGLNTWNSAPFHYDFDGCSLVVDGPNGSGKSSLASSIIWAFTGTRPRDQTTTSAHLAEPVVDSQEKAAGSWPPIATYPPKVSDLATFPSVAVSIVLVNDHGNEVTLKRQLTKGSTELTWSKKINIPEVFVLTGLEMPARISHIRLKDGASGLPDAVQQLTGLDEIISIGGLCDWLTHGAREYRSYAKTNKLKDHQQGFANAIDEARRILSTIGVTLPPYSPADAKTNEDPLVKKGMDISAIGKELAEALKSDIDSTLKLGDLVVQKNLAAAISNAENLLAKGLTGLPNWNFIFAISSALSEDDGASLLKAVELAENRLSEALATNIRAQADTRYQLKAVGAAWHRDHSQGAIEECPLCTQSLAATPALKQELDTMRAAGEAATKTFSDNINSIYTTLSASLPEQIRNAQLGERTASPRSKLLNNFNTSLGSKSANAKMLARFSLLADDQMAIAPSIDLPVCEVPTPSGETTLQHRQLEELMAWARRSVALARWFDSNKNAWETWWENLAKVRPTPASVGVADGGVEVETLGDHLNRLSTALRTAEPYMSAAGHLRLAIQNARRIIEISDEQRRRDSIAEALSDLKLLKGVGEAVARQAISDLSSRIQQILQGLHSTERLQFHSAQLSKKDGIAVRAGFDHDIRVDATLIANTSWLRSFLWAFVFALREEATQQHGGDPLPLFIFDDPQATFDISHRLNWAQYVAGLQSSESKAQILIATHDEGFLPTLEAAGINARSAHISPARSDTGPLAILEGNSLERMWERANNDKGDPAKAVMFLAESRVYIEGMLRSMLTGDGADLTKDSVSALSDRIKIHSAAQTPPWNRPSFQKLLGHLKGPPQLAHVERAHHGSRSTLTYAEANDFHKHWKNKLATQLDTCFRDMREFRLLHGTVMAWRLPPPSVELPEGYKDTIANFPLSLLGRASAFSDGKASEGIFTYEEFNDPSEKKTRLGNHLAFRLTTRSIEPVAKPGDVLIVQNYDQPTPNSLVIARVDDRIMARRFVISDRSSDVAVLTAHAVNPYEIAAPVVAHRATIVMHKIVGVLFDNFRAKPQQVVDEIVACNGESDVSGLLRQCHGLVEVNGQSAQPLALDHQFLLIGKELDVSLRGDLRSVVDQPVIAADSNDTRYFKRLRIVGNEVIILESLDAGGWYEPQILAAPGTSSSNALTRLWPVLGVLFERPGSSRD
jgi:hypothetical protein